MSANPNPYAYLQPFAVWENAFTPAELDTVVALGDSLTLNKGTVLSDGPEVTYDALRIARDRDARLMLLARREGSVEMVTVSDGLAARGLAPMEE